MTTPDRQPFDFGVALHRRKAAFARARELAEAHPDDPTFERLRALVQEAVDRLRKIPPPLVEHPQRLAMVADAERAAVAELRRLRGAAAVGEEETTDAPGGDAGDVGAGVGGPVDDAPPAIDEPPAVGDEPAPDAPRPVGKDAAVEPAEAP